MSSFVVTFWSRNSFLSDEYLAKKFLYGCILAGLFSVNQQPPPTTEIFESEFPKNFQISLNKRKSFFHNRKFTSIRIGFCLSKRFFTHFDFIVFVLSVFCDSKQEAVEHRIKTA